MSKRKVDPIVAVLAYFKEASLEVAETALALAAAEVKARRPQSAPKAPRVKKPKPSTLATPLTAQFGVQG